jgi:hypothetical protein
VIRPKDPAENSLPYALDEQGKPGALAATSTLHNMYGWNMHRPALPSFNNYMADMSRVQHPFSMPLV